MPNSSRDAGISMRFSTRRRTSVAMATGLPRYARNDKVGTHEKWIGVRRRPACNPLDPLPAQLRNVQWATPSRPGSTCIVVATATGATL